MELKQVTTECSLAISFPKTKLLVARTGIMEADLAPLNIGGSAVESVLSFRYLGSFVESHGEVALDLDDKMVSASSAFGALIKSVFRNSSLSRQTKKIIYQAVILGVPLYATETWPAKQKDTRRLEGLYHCCLRYIMGIIRAL